MSRWKLPCSCPPSCDGRGSGAPHGCGMRTALCDPGRMKEQLGQPPHHSPPLQEKKTCYIMVGPRKSFKALKQAERASLGMTWVSWSAQAPAQLDKAGANENPMLFQGRSNSRMSSREIRGGPERLEEVPGAMKTGRTFLKGKEKLK